VDTSSPRPIELILARNLLSSLSTPAFLANRANEVIFYNDAAGALLGRRFEERGTMSADEWLTDFGPLDERGEPIPLEEQPVTIALRDNRAAHARHRIRSLGGAVHIVEVSGMPIIGAGGFYGAMVFFWLSGESPR
jgi:PAS domain-containing protein